MLYLAAVAAGLLAGFAVRGSLRNLGENVRLRWVAALYVALGAQLFLAYVQAAWLTEDVRFAVLLGSYGLLGIWLGLAAATHKSWIRWCFAVIAFGAALNFAAIAPNRGMPVSRAALESAGAPVPSGEANRFAVKHVLAGPDTIFNGLGDTIPLPPLRDVVSIGDVFIGLGIIVVIASGMRLRPESEQPLLVTPVQSLEHEPSQVVTVEPRGAARGGFLDRERSIEEFLHEFATGYSVGKGIDVMSDDPRHPSDSRVVLSQAMSITDANLAGNVHGGVIMKLVDTAAGLAAIKHAHGRVVTVSMDEMSFLEPVFLTDVVTLYAQVNDVGRTSMEVGARVEAENTVTGERRHVSSAYLVFVALDADGKPRPVQRLEPQTDEERSRMEDAKIRRRHRIARKEALVARRQTVDAPASSVAESGPPAPASS